MIEITGIHKSFGARHAVRGVSLRIEPGETFGLLGPNGAGKSTTINMLSGLLPPDAGQIVINGLSDPTQPALRRQLGIAPQALALYEDLTAEENIRFLGRLYGLSGRALQARTDYALTLGGLQDRRHDLVMEYSGGMKRRLNLAAALIHEPKILFLDEPTVGVDPQSRNLLFDNIRQLADEGMTIVYTTHYMEEAERLCDRIAIMDQGQILALDRLNGLIDQHGGKAVVHAEFSADPETGTNRHPHLVSVFGHDQFQLEANTLRLESADPVQEVARLLRAGAELRFLRIDRPDLETVFLNLTGRRLRDE